jgi:hypothetical protein
MSGIAAIIGIIGFLTLAGWMALHLVRKSTE